MCLAFCVSYFLFDEEKLKFFTEVSFLFIPNCPALFHFSHRSFHKIHKSEVKTQSEVCFLQIDLI